MVQGFPLLRLLLCSRGLFEKRNKGFIEAQPFLSSLSFDHLFNVKGDSPQRNLLQMNHLRMNQW